MTRILTKQACDLRCATRLLAMTVALGTPALAQAAIRCIENESQFKPTLDAALASADTVEEVRIKSGVYSFFTGEIGYFGVLQGSGKTLSIRGGWSGNAGMCTTQNGNSTDTVLNGNSQRPVFGINASTTFTGSITIENMLFTGAGPVPALQPARWVSVSKTAASWACWWTGYGSRAIRPRPVSPLPRCS